MNEPYRFFRTYGRDWDRGTGKFTSPDFISVSTEELCGLALELFNDPITGPIFCTAGIHGDIEVEEEGKISFYVEAYATKMKWERPDPSKLVVSTVLARQLAAGEINTDNLEEMHAFIEDRCEGLGQDSFEPKRLKWSEIVPILNSMEAHEELKDPYRPLRKRTFRRGEMLFPDLEDEGSLFSITIGGFAGRLAYHKYGLGNRNLRVLHGFGGLGTMYATRKIDRFNDEDAVEILLSLNCNDFIDDRAD